MSSSQSQETVSSLNSGTRHGGHLRLSNEIAATNTNGHAVIAQRPVLNKDDCDNLPGRRHAARDFTSAIATAVEEKEDGRAGGREISDIDRRLGELHEFLKRAKAGGIAGAREAKDLPPPRPPTAGQVSVVAAGVAATVVVSGDLPPPPPPPPPSHVAGVSDHASIISAEAEGKVQTSDVVGENNGGMLKIADAKSEECRTGVRESWSDNERSAVT